MLVMLNKKIKDKKNPMKFQKTRSSVVGLQANSQPAAANINIKAVNFQPISNVCHDQTTKMFN